MPIKVGDRLPEAKFRVMGPNGPAAKTTDEVFKGKKVVSSWSCVGVSQVRRKLPRRAN